VLQRPGRRADNLGVQQRRWVRGGRLIAVPVLTGAVGGAAPVAADLALLVTALVAAGVLWRRGAPAWRLMAVAVLAGLVGRLVAPFPAGAPAAGLPVVALGVVAVLVLAGRRRLRSGGARLLTEAALFCSGFLVLAQVLVVDPASGRGLPAPSRVVLEVDAVLTAALLAAVLVLMTVSPGARRVSGALLLASVASAAGAHAAAVAAPLLPTPWSFDAGTAAEAASLVLLCLAARCCPDTDDDTGARLGAVCPLLPQLVLVTAALVYVTAPSLGADPTPAAGGALLCCLALTVLHRVVVAREEAVVAGRLRRSEAHFRSLVRSSSDAVLVLDGDLRISWAAPALQPPAGEPALEGRLLPDVVDPEDAEQVRAWLAADVPTGLRSFRLQDSRADWRVLEAGVSDLRADADVRALVLHCRDVTARLDREHQLSSLAFVDPLTGLPNRAAQRGAMHALLAERAEHAAGGGAGEDVALLLIEVHGLGEARESAGQAVADAALVEVARRLRATVRAEDQVARIGPELFSVLASGAGDEPDRLADRCLGVIEAPVLTDAGIVDLTAAVGLVPLTAGLTERTAVDRAELALLDARAAGAGSVRRHRAELTAARDRRERLRQDLVGARERGELGLAWQPVVSLADRRVTGVEALLRWRHPDLGDVPPEEFLPLAERAGLVVDLHRWVLREATATAAGLPDPELKLGVNVSGRHLASGTLIGDVTAALRESGLAPERLVVEVPESALDGARVADDVAALRLMGVHLALDDFGSGQSSLAAVGRLPLDILKLDRVLLSRIDRDPHTRAVCEAVVALGRALGIDVVAQGVETSSQLAVLQSMGCGFAQGFLLSRPVGLVGLHLLLEADAGRLWPGLPGRVGVS
jgi:diguanylate cyclase (GGDEF)-like protein/PAS domain S-box-containing protein